MAIDNGTAYLYIYPITLSNCIVTSTYNGNVTNYIPTNNGTCLYANVGLLISAYDGTTISINADGCQSYYINSGSTVEGGSYTITMEPATGYKKLYAWKMSTKGKFSDNVPEYIYTTEYPVTSDTAIYDASGNLISNAGIDLSNLSSDGETIIYADCDDWNTDPTVGGVEE